MAKPNLFALSFAPQRRIVIPGEFCIIASGQFAKRTLSEAAAEEMIKFSAQAPHERLGMIRRAAEGGVWDIFICISWKPHDIYITCGSSSTSAARGLWKVYM
jgi:hypothetical protein